jgi:uncharacterized protein YheU (UPF0270 family)
MKDSLTREELINLVENIINCEGTEKEIDEMLELVEKNVPHPEVSDLIYWSEEDLTSEEIVDRALEYKAIQL